MLKPVKWLYIMIHATNDSKNMSLDHGERDWTGRIGSLDGYGKVEFWRKYVEKGKLEFRDGLGGVPPPKHFYLVLKTYIVHQVLLENWFLVLFETLSQYSRVVTLVVSCQIPKREIAKHLPAFIWHWVKQSGIASLWQKWCCKKW